MVKELPPVSIGIPFFNAESDILDAVRSVFIQTHRNWELILVDDGSTDHSLELAQSINDPRIRVISDGQNKQLAARLNQIARLARFDFVARMDADDLIAPDRIERQLSVLLSNPNLDLVSTGVYSLDNENVPIGRRCMPLQHEIIAKALLSGSCGIVNAACLGRREWFLRNPFDESLSRAQDANLWISAFSKNDLNAVVLPEPLYFYREDNNVSEKRILASYKVLRYSILHAARLRFSTWDRIQSYVKNCVKSAIIWGMARFGKLDIARKRRIAQLLSESEQQEVIRVIKKIQATQLPVTKVERQNASNS